jgi:hypothetical protein
VKQEKSQVYLALKMIRPEGESLIESGKKV